MLIGLVWFIFLISGFFLGLVTSKFYGNYKSSDTDLDYNISVIKEDIFTLSAKIDVLGQNLKNIQGSYGR